MVAAYRTFASVKVTGRFDEELCKILPKSWKYLGICGKQKILRHRTLRHLLSSTYASSTFCIPRKSNLRRSLSSRSPSLDYAIPCLQANSRLIYMLTMFQELAMTLLTHRHVRSEIRHFSFQTSQPFQTMPQPILPCFYCWVLFEILTYRCLTYGKANGEARNYQH